MGSVHIATLWEEFSKRNSFFLKKTDVNPLTTLFDLADNFNEFEIFEKEIASKKNNAPNWPKALEILINEIESFVSNVPPNEPNSIQIGYDSATAGKTLHLHKLSSLLVIKTKDHSLIDDKAVMDLIRGVVYAYKLPKLKEELEHLKNETTNEIIPPNRKKIKCKVGPAFAAYLIDETVRHGVFELPYGNNHVQNAKFLLTIIDIDTTPATLAKELSENTNSLTVENRPKIVMPKQKRT